MGEGKAKRNGLTRWNKLLRHEVGKPTYEFVGEVDRVDERDVVFARGILKQGSEEYKAYYEMHPELEKVDSSLRIFNDPELSKAQRLRSFPENPLALAMAGIAQLTPRSLGDKVDGPLSKPRADIDPETAARAIKGLGLYLGADEVRIAELNGAWVYSHNGRWFYGGARWGQPVELKHKFAITLGFAHTEAMLWTGRGPSLAGSIESGNIYCRMAETAVRMAAFIRLLGYPARAHHVANYQLMQVPVAIDAGLGQLGRLGFLVSKKYGPAIRLVTVTTDLPLAADRPVDIGVEDFCEKCAKCADLCPVGAIPAGKNAKTVVRGVKKWAIDREKCFRLWNAMGTSCMVCLSVCPWTKPDKHIHKVSRELAARYGIARQLLIWADDLFYGRKPGQRDFPAWLRFNGRN